MFSSETMDVAIGMVFLFLLVSLVCSSIREALETVLKYRARNLQRGIQEMLGDGNSSDLVGALYKHPLVYSLYRGPYDARQAGNLPSYIPARSFSLALLDVVRQLPSMTSSGARVPGAQEGVSFLELRAAVMKMGNESVKGALIPLIDSAEGDLGIARQNIEEWYNSAMDRVSGWYKRRTQQILMGVGLFLALLMNIDAIGIARYLSTSQTARAALISQIQSQKTPNAPTNTELADPAAWLERQGGMPIGWLFAPEADQTKEDFARDWRRAPVSLRGWTIKVSGLLLTTFAVTLGAPFWFDVLNKFMIVRSTIKPHEKSKEENSKE